jgi:hypothetical protein
MTGLKSWNFWTVVDGTLYGYRAHHPDDYLLLLQGADIQPRRVYAYGGKTIRDWRARAEEHMWGRGKYHNPAQPWADTVLGWTPNGTVDDLITAGGYFAIWQGRTVPLLLSLGEIFIAIKLKRPMYNHSFNLGNRRRIPIYEAENQRELRDLARREHGGVVPTRTRPRAKSRNQQSWSHSLALASPTARRISNIPRWAGYYRRRASLLVLAAMALMFLPGLPGMDVVAWMLDWVDAYRSELIAGGVLIAAALIAVPRMFKAKPRRRRSSRRRRSRRR